MPFIKGVPRQVIVARAIGLLVKEYMNNPAFAEERRATQQKYEGALKEVANAIWDWTEKLPSLTIDSLANQEVLQEELRKRVGNVPELVAYTWGPKILFIEDLYNALQMNEMQKLIYLSGELSSIVGSPPIVMLPIPISLVYLGTRKEIHEYINNELNNVPSHPDWKDIPHALELHVKWFYARKVLGKKPKEIAEDPNLNPMRYDTLELSHISHAIRNIDKLLGGKSRARGRPKAKKD